MAHPTMTAIFADISTMGAVSELAPGGGPGRRREGGSFGDEKVIRAAIAAGDFRTAAALLHALESTLLETGRDAVYVVAETCRRTRNYAAILPLLRAIPAQALRSSEDDVMPLLAECAKSNNMRHAQPVVAYLDSQGVLLSARAFSAMAKGFGRQGNDLMVDRLLQWCEVRQVVADQVLLNSLMDAYIRCERADKALQLFNLVAEALPENKDAVGDEAGTVGAVGTGAGARTGSWAGRVLGAREERKAVPHTAFLLSSGVRPNVRTCNIMLKGLRGRDAASFDQCVQLHQDMLSWGLTPDSVTTNTLVDAAVTANAPGQALRWLSGGPPGSPASFGLPGVEAYTSVIAGFAARANVTGAFDVLDLMRRRNVAPNGYTLTSLMTACVAGGKMRRARELLREGRLFPGVALSGPEQANLHGAYVMGLCRLHNDLREEEQQLEQQLEGAKTFGVRKVRGNNLESRLEEEYWAVGRRRGEYLRDAQLALLDMDRRDLRPDAATLNAFMQALCKQAQPRVRGALQLLQAMVQMQIAPDDYTYSILFTALGRSGLVMQALQLYQAAAADRDMDTAAVNSLLRAFVSGPEPSLAVGLFYELTARNESLREAEVFVPDKVTFTILFLAVAKSLGPQQIRQPGRAQDAWNVGNSLGAPGAPGDADQDSPYLMPPAQRSPLSALYRQLQIVNIVVEKEEGGAGVALTSVDAVAGALFGEAAKPPQTGEAESAAYIYDASEGRLYERAEGGATDLDSTGGAGKGGIGDLDELEQLIAGVSDDELSFDDAVEAPRTSYGSTSSRTAAVSASVSASAGWYPPRPLVAPDVSLSAQSFQRAQDVTRLPEPALRDLYKSMRGYGVQADATMAKALNQLFDLPAPSLFSARGRGFAASKELARAVFEDLVINSDAHPRQLPALLRACAYSRRKSEEFLNDEALKRLRSSAATYRVFKKYGWNKMESGWSPFF
ncbi:hypothetical protein B484DRAFT_444451 [Ochromonadaceae sp. CCMP2298]|nr:hypothetical protein B484DRAFT_444451 [Ochromonadaceae sp. CCMP2298]